MNTAPCPGGDAAVINKAGLLSRDPSSPAGIFGRVINLKSQPGKLPMATHKEPYGLEYGEDALEIHMDAFKAGDRVLIVDDVMATGGTAAAAQRLIRLTGAQPVALTIFIELSSLPGREKVEGLPVFSVLRY